MQIGLMQIGPMQLGWMQLRLLRLPTGGFTIALCMQLDGEPEAEEHYERHIEAREDSLMCPAARAS
jgi:hypothetical protein